MANQEHLDILKQGVKVWNEWRKSNPNAKPDLNGANLSEANLNGANLIGAELNDASLYLADLRGAFLRGANLRNADIGGANLRNADLRGADIRWANISEADLSGANLGGANLAGSNLSETHFERADLTGCHVYAISAWNLKIDEGTQQSNLIITRPDEPTVTVDDIEVAQFIYLLLNNPNVRHVIDTITSKVVLILGRFTEERKPILDALRGELRKRDYSPVLFDFDKPTSRDLTETISTLAGMSRFVIADITSAKSIPQELMAIVPNLPSVPVQPLMLASELEYGMFEHFKRYPWVLPVHPYRDLDDLLATLGEKVVTPAETKVAELRQK